MACLLHICDGCKCTVCGETRDEQHFWVHSGEEHDFIYDNGIEENDCIVKKCSRCGAELHHKQLSGQFPDGLDASGHHSDFLTEKIQSIECIIYSDGKERIIKFSEKRI